MSLGFRQARDVIPSIQETRARVRERVSEVRKAQTDRATQLREAARNRPNPALQARRFVQTLNDVSATTAARLNNEEPPESEPRASIRIGGETYPYTQVNAPRQALDVFA